MSNADWMQHRLSARSDNVTVACHDHHGGKRHVTAPGQLHPWAGTPYVSLLHPLNRLLARSATGHSEALSLGHPLIGKVVKARRLAGSPPSVLALTRAHGGRHPMFFCCQGAGLEMAQGGVFVVGGAGFEAAVEDADEAVGELA